MSRGGLKDVGRVVEHNEVLVRTCWIWVYKDTRQSNQDVNLTFVLDGGNA